MEVSHRSKYFAPVLEAAENGIRELLSVPDNYRILFLQGGASQQFAMVPMNLLGKAPGHRQTADYVLTGLFSELAYKEAQTVGRVRAAGSSDFRYWRTADWLAP